MKPINEKELFKQVKSGNISRDVFLKSTKKAEPVVLDDRESIERVADELEQFSKAILTMNQQQAQAISQTLKVIMTAVDSISSMKVAVSNTSTVVKKWGVEEIERDKNGLIKQFKVIAKEVL